jgi:LPXTG-motif cell wall-anchored protein
VGILTDDPLESYSLLLGPAELAATGVDAGGTAGIALSAGAFLVFGTALVVVRRRRRRNA